MKPIPKLQLVPPLPSLIYCGCYEQSGHYFFLPGMVSTYNWPPDIYRLNHNSLIQLDCGFTPQDTTVRKAWYHSERVNDIRYNVISFWDRSVDSRPGSHSTFLLFGGKCFNDALAECRAAFPQVFARFKFEIKLERNMFM